MEVFEVLMKFLEERMFLMGKNRNRMSDYRRRGHWLPFIPWLYDIVMPIAFSVILVVALAGTLTELNYATASLERIQEEPEVYIPYQEVEASKSLGRIWAEDFIKTAPPNVVNWTVDESVKPRHPIDPKLCAYVKEFPTSLLSTHIASGEGTETRIQVYGAGQATKNFHLYAEQILKCEKGTITTTDTATILQFDFSFVMAMGDAIVSVRTVNNIVRDEMLAFYLSNTASTLTASECIDLSVTTEDANRSFFYVDSEYSGLTEIKEMETTVNILDIPTPTSVSMLEVLNRNAREPIGPLPSDFPELPTPLDRPLAPESVPDVENFAGQASYLIADLDGPGCGWEWSSQGQPVYNFEDLENRQQEAINNKQLELDGEAQDYVDSKLGWAFSVGLLASQINDWNIYVTDTNAVHERWEWLRSERAKLSSPWNEYIRNYREWETFDARKADAVTKYEAAVAQCIADEEALTLWQEQWGELWDQQQEYKNNPPVAPTPTPSVNTPTDAPEPVEPTPDGTNSPNPSESPTAAATPTTAPTVEPPVVTPTLDPIATMYIPQPPAGCDTEPQRPSIVDQEKPSEPQPPIIPEGVTIPDTWEKP